MIDLRAATRQAWTDAVVADVGLFLLDHAACERKASAMAMSMVAHYPDRPALVEAMIRLAQEELEHFRQVWVHLNARGLVLGRDTRDPYVGALIKSFRQGTDVYLLDRLLVAGLIEARGHERFGLVADALTDDPTLGAFYRNITRSEGRHAELFIEFARGFFDGPVVDERLDALLDLEATIVQSLPIRAALH